MIYIVEDGIEEVKVEQLDFSKLTYGFFSLVELESEYERFHFEPETIEDCKVETTNFRTSYMVEAEYVYCKLHLIKLEDIMSSDERMAIFIRHNLCLVVAIRDANHRIQKMFEVVIERMKRCECSVEKFLYVLFDEMLRSDNRGLEDLEFGLNLLEDTIVAKKVADSLPYELLKRKRELFVLRNYYEELNEYSEILLDDELEIFSKKNEKYLIMLNSKIGRLKQNTLFLRESLVQLREAYQSYLDYSLNSIMKVFTVVTTIFLPLSLIVGWYGMNFTMPEYAWNYGYLFVIGLTVTVLIICFWFFKKHKYL